MRVIFDLDDTISITKNRDYVNAIPITDTIEKMRQMKADGWEIVIYSARGQVSCNGDLELIEKKNRNLVEEWLKKNDVPCDELIFGKPIGDLYVDDKGMSLAEFLDKPIQLLHGGGSGQKIYRIGSVVKKEFKTQEETELFKKWNEKNAGILTVPRVHSYLYNSVYMDYIDGKRMCDEDDINVEQFIAIWEKCKRQTGYTFDIMRQLSVLRLNYTGVTEADELLEEVHAYLYSIRDELRYESSFCHGDMILSNVIKSTDGQLYFLDARYIEGASSYLLDIAKFRMSLSGYENIFGIAERDFTDRLPELDRWLMDIGKYDVVMALEIMYILRLYRYKNDEGKIKVIKFALREAKRWKTK